MDPLLSVISVGAGHQSTTAALMGKYDCGIFADTQNEPSAVMRHLAWLERQLPYPIHRVTGGDLAKSALDLRTSRTSGNRYLKTSLPVHTADEGNDKEGMGRRICTTDFKVRVITAKVRELLGKKQIRSSKVLVRMAICYSLDEYHRMKPNKERWIENHFPLIDAGMSRADCLLWLEKNGYPKPPRSACKFCPLQSDDHWLALSREEMAQAIQFEKDLQAGYAKTTTLTSVPYLHESRVPLSRVKFKPGWRVKDKARQLGLFANKCNSGFCGV